MIANGKKPAAADALAMLDALKQGYLAAVPEHFDEIEDLVMACAGNPGDTSVYRELFRKVHSLKGGAGTYGLPIISTVCHQFEDYLGQWGRPAAGEQGECIDGALAYVDLLRGALQRVVDGDGGTAEIEESLARLKGRGAAGQRDVLLVSASRSTQRLCLGLLECLPVRVSVVEDGMTALQRLLHERFDLLLTGMEVPVLNGAALIAAMRLSRGMNSATKTIILTSDGALEMPPDLAPDAVVRRDAGFAARLVNTTASLLKIAAHP